MQPINKIEFDQNVRKIYESIFAIEDPYGEPFQPKMKNRLLLYTFSYGLHPDEPWLIPVVATMKVLGENGFYLTLLASARSEEQPWHWYVPIEEAGAFIRTTFPVENVIYSTNGQWGIIGSHEEHAIAGGAEIFIKALQNSVSDWDSRLEMFMEKWIGLYNNNKKVKIDWLPTLLSHVYGVSESNKILHEYELDWLLPRTNIFP